jgi:secondary thiamine-phosphate synthase enzyme
VRVRPSARRVRASAGAASREPASNTKAAKPVNSNRRAGDTSAASRYSRGVRQATHRLDVRTRGAGLYDVTPELAVWVERQGVRTGLLTVFIRHTSASLVVQENADPDVLRDLDAFLRRVVPEERPNTPEEDRLYRHTAEGPDDMPAHIRAALTATQLAVPIVDGALALGTWQAVYVFEHRRAAHGRELVLHLVGE